MGWHLKSPAFRLFTQLFVNVQIKESIKALHDAASLAFVRGIHRWPMNSPHKGPVTWKMFPFDDVIMHEMNVWNTPPSWSPIELTTAILIRSSLSWFYIWHCDNSGRKSIRFQNHSRHPIAHQLGWDIGCLYLTLTGKLWGVCCEDLGENWPHYNGTALYLVNASQQHYLRTRAITHYLK